MRPRDVSKHQGARAPLVEVDADDSALHGALLAKALGALEEALPLGSHRKAGCQQQDEQEHRTKHQAAALVGG